MDSLEELNMQELLRKSIRELLEQPDNDLELSSLVAVVSSDPDLRRIANEELAPRNAHLELHLGGRKVQGHSTAAKSFGQFVSQIAESVKITVRDIAGNVRIGDELLIEAGPGSVKTTFIAPPRTLDPDAIVIRESLKETVVDEDSYSEALRRVAVVLANSDPETPNDPALDAALGLIPPSSRAPLRKALDEAHKQSWSIEGSFTQRGLNVTHVKVRPHAVSYLRERLSETSEAHDTLESTGYLDGHTWSTGTMRFIAVGSKRPISASFGSTQVQLEVGKLDAKPSQKVRARFSVILISGLASSRKTYVLDSIELVPELDQPQLF